MSTLLNRVHRGLFAAVIGLLCLSYLSPMAALAYGEQVPGDAATIANTGGSGAPLRETVGYDSAVLTTIDEQTPVSILEGPIAANDGSLWYLVSVWDQTGYVDAAFIGSATPVDEPPAEEVPTEQEVVDEVPVEEAVDQVPAEDVPAEDVAEEAPVLPWQEPTDYGVVVNNIQDGTFPDEGLACRTAANEDASSTYRFGLGETVEITGAEFWEGDFSWYPVNCAGGGGFAKGFYVSVAVETEEPAVEEAVVDEVPAEDVAVDEGTENEVPSEEGVAPEEVTEEVAPEETDVAEEEAQTEVATEEVATEEVATEEGVTEEVASDVATEDESAGDVEVAAPEEVEASASEEETATNEVEVRVGQPDQAPDLSQAIGSAEVTGTNGDGVRCRIGPSSDAAVITVLTETTVVQVMEQTNGEWLQIICGNQLGYASTEFLWSGGAGEGESDFAASSETDFAAAANGTATVSGTGGDGVRCRTSGSLSASIITVLGEGASVTTRGASSGGWVPVVCAGQNGFVSADYLSVGGSTVPGGTTGGGQASGTASVTGTGGQGVRCRTSGSLSANIITVLAEGTSVSTRGSASGGWTPVVCGGQNGFISSQYLTTGSGSGSTPTPAPGGTNNGGSLAANDHARVTSTLNLRYNPSMTAGIATTAPAGTVVLIVSGPESGFYKVDWDGLGGYMHGDYLTKTSEGLSERGGSAAPAPEPGGNNGGGGTSTGNAMVDFAMGYLGYPYVWATAGPASFDCSGFTYWVTKNVIGIDIGRGLWTQAASGTPVSRGNLQPGDIVFFQNTYKPGLSHNGLYIGGNQFIHAENENTGVKISDLNSSYYSSRWYGAVRLG